LLIVKVAIWEHHYLLIVVTEVSLFLLSQILELGGYMRLGIKLLLIVFLLSGCATTGDLNLVKSDLDSTKEEVQAIKKKVNEIEFITGYLVYNLTKFIEIYNKHIEEFHKAKNIFN
jgi:hypothetical protein